MKRPRVAALLLLASVAACVAACTSSPRRQDASGEAAERWDTARQLVLVETADWNASQGTLHAFERDAGGGWRATGLSTPVTVGRAGIAWGLGLHADPGGEGPRKREGDGRAPAGVFALGTAFGYARSAATSMPYQPMDEHDWCIDVSGSPLYNRIVDAREVGAAAIEGSTEPMRRDLHAGGDQRYERGLVIRHNERGEAGAGSCIFAHLWSAPGVATAGCTAMDAAAMTTLFGWLQPDRQPIFVLLPRAELRRLARSWKLPAP